MKGKKVIILIICLSLMLTTGCWDKIELNDRAFINGMIIDINEKAQGEQDGDKGESKEVNTNDPFCEDKPNRLKISFGVINPSKLQGGENALIRETVEAVNIPDAMETLGQSISRKPFYGQMIIIEFTEGILKEPKLFKEVLDEFERKAVINRNMKVVALGGNVEAFAKIEPKLESFIGATIEGILENAGVLSNTVDMTLNDILVASRETEGTFTMPVVRVEDVKENVLKIDQLALIKDYKLLKILDTKYIKAYKMLHNRFKNGRKLVDYKGIAVPYYIFNSRAKIRLVSAGDTPTFKVMVDTEGDIEQFEREKEIADPKVIADIKKKAEEALKAELEATIKYFQDEIGVDYLGLGEYTSKYNHKFYEKHKDNWDETFKKAKFEIETECNIRRIGTSTK